ncbi:MAG: hypothetical protein ACYC92_05265 [Candidatus Acidiferrales bacterium]
MAKRATKQPTRKIGLEMKAYIQFVAPAQGTVRPEIMAHVRRSVEKNRKLLQLLAQ